MYYVPFQLKTKMNVTLKLNVVQLKSDFYESAIFVLCFSRKVLIMDLDRYACHVISQYLLIINTH